MRAIFENEEFINILNAFYDGILIFDNENRLLLINKSAEKYLKIGEEVLGKSALELANHPTLKFIFYLLGNEIKEVSEKEIEINKNLILQITSLPILKNQQIIGKLVILSDITQRKRVEKLKTEFVSVSAHQLRTPLTSFKWALEVLSRENFNNFQKAIIEKAKESTEKMLKLINDLLDVAKIEEGTYVLKLQKANFEKILEKVIENFQKEIKTKKILLQLKILKKLPKIKVDAEKISIVLENLLENAIVYNFEGGSIMITLDLIDNNLFFSIEDSGIGIPRDAQKNIFQKFFRAPNAVKAKTDGSGLGLFVAKNIIESHGGRIWFNTQEGRGTTFYFSLPIK